MRHMRLSEGVGGFACLGMPVFELGISADWLSEDLVARSHPLNPCGQNPQQLRNAALQGRPEAPTGHPQRGRTGSGNGHRETSPR